MTSVDIMDNKKKDFPGLLKKHFGIISGACREADISRQTYYNWRNADNEFATACDEAAEYTGDFVENQLLSLIKDKDTSATIFYCKTRLKNRGYVERIEQTGKDGNAQEHKHEHEFKNLTKEQVDALVRIGKGE